MEFARRFTSNHEMMFAPTSNQSQDARQPDGLLRVDARPPKSPNSSPASSPTPASAAQRDDAPRRRRSHSECLLLAKQHGTQDLPGPCQEYITNVKHILAKNDEFQMNLKRRRSMNLSHPSLFKQ